MIEALGDATVSLGTFLAWVPAAGCVGAGIAWALLQGRYSLAEERRKVPSKPGHVAAFGAGLDDLTPVGGVEDVARIAAIEDEPARTAATLEMVRRLHDRAEARVTRIGRDDEEPPAGGGLEVTQVMPRYRPETPAEPWPIGRGVSPDGLMLRASTGRREPVRVRVLARAQVPVSAARVVVRVVRSDLDQAGATVAAAFDRRPWLRQTAPDVARHGRHRFAGRHRVDVVTRQVTA